VLGERAQPIIMPTANATAPTERLAASAQWSPSTKRRKAQSSSIVANIKTAKSGLRS